jgi:hypothetical protein
MYFDVRDGFIDLNHEHRNCALILKIRHGNALTRTPCGVWASYQVSPERPETAGSYRAWHKTQAHCDVNNRGVKERRPLCAEARYCLPHIRQCATLSLLRQPDTSTQKPSIRSGPKPVNIPTAQFRIIRFSVTLPHLSWSSKRTLFLKFFNKNLILASCFLRHSCRCEFWNAYVPSFYVMCRLGRSISVAMDRRDGSMLLWTIEVSQSV